MPLLNVDPGDLIRSTDWNGLVAAINALEVRVAELESGGPGGPPRIDEVLSNAIVTAGDTIQIYGARFDFSLGGHSVFFGDTRAVTFFSGSSDSLLVVRVPDVVVGATEQGTAMTLKVGNLVGIATRAITIKSKPVVVSGNVGFSFKGTRPSQTPTAGATFFYDFDLKSNASENLIVTIAPTITAITPLPGGTPPLQTLIAVLDSDGTLRENGQIALPEGATKTISLRLNVPAGTTNVQYNLSATATAPGVPNVTESLPTQQVGQATEQPDPTITNFEFFAPADANSVFSAATGGVAGVDGTISVFPGQSSSIETRATFGNIAQGATNLYDLTAVIVAPANGWSTKINDITLPLQTVPGPGGTVPLFFDITAPTAAGQAVVRFTLTRRGLATNNKRSIAYRLILR